ncbi:hypothetical protein CICLE_v10002149mg [Citrus x clementina]|uniref:Uncharacterized protein n=2 Tax=Citrus TaxID=2706 RepID=V4T0N4_CITCL|nr:uncharacterized protein LOC18041123 [Citrus x clementina]XP_024952834.2 uncharacterized protein LOC112495471 [Citrus sinensis]XP_052298116.1 uncharacterized protein LOC112495471 [Citrus sinensis]ESR44940.1 hypothetical protein CICLE_v10002149mg [Citrus x clementina]
MSSDDYEDIEIEVDETVSYSHEYNEIDGSLSQTTTTSSTNEDEQNNVSFRAEDIEIERLQGDFGDHHYEDIEIEAGEAAVPYSHEDEEIDGSLEQTITNISTNEDEPSIINLGAEESENLSDIGSTDVNVGHREVDLRLILSITNFVLELPSAVFDQLSSVHKPLYALLGMLMSFTALFLCIGELVYKARKEKVTWKWRGTLPWLYYPSQNQKPFGNFKDIFGLACALCQCTVTAIDYSFVHRHADNPIKVSLLPIIFAFGQLCSEFCGKSR